MDNVVRIKGVENLPAYLEIVRQVEAGTVSPGGAAAILRVSRQAIDSLIDAGHVRAWLFYEGWPKARCTYKHVAVRDLVEWGVRTGRIQSAEDCALRFPHLQDEIDRARLLLSSSV